MKKSHRVLDLRPTQFAVGMLEVDEKIKVVGAFGKKERKAFVKETPVPVIKGPDKLLYVVDHHHFLCVCYHVGIGESSDRGRRGSLAPKDAYRQFWAWMTEHRNSYPFCQFGEGPRNELYLPKDIRGLADDPYRSLAWFVRKAGAFENSEKNFAEFTWANFFRKEKLLDQDGVAGLEKAMLAAVALAQSPKASKLPGFGKLNLTERAEAKFEVRHAARRVKRK